MYPAAMQFKQQHPGHNLQTNISFGARFLVTDLQQNSEAKAGVRE
jgi:hypothetical protein